MRRASLLTLAAGVLASLALSGSSFAGGYIGYVDPFTVTPTGTASTFTFILSGAVSDPVTLDSAGLTGISYNSFAVGGDTYEVVSFTPASHTTSTFEFSFNSPGTYLGGGVDGLSGGGSAVNFTGGGTGYGVTAVPEPASLALIGLGMTGVLVYRRLRPRATSKA